MTEYTVTSQHIRDYKNSKARTSDWVSDVNAVEFYSPSVPRSELSDDDDGLSEPSDVESSHSIPPKLMLRYGDGRPDIPIPHVHDLHDIASPSSHTNPVLRSQTFPHSTHYRTGSDAHSHALSGRSRAQDQRERLMSHVPEEIQILPSYPVGGARAGTQHSRSKSLPRNAFSRETSPVPPLSLPPSRIPQQPVYGAALSQRSHHGGPGPQINPSQSQPSPWHTHGPGHLSRHNPPSIVYAPSHHSRHPNYHPPAMYSYPPKIGPNGMIYSHSAPVPGTQYPPPGAPPYPSAFVPSGPSRRDQSPSMSHHTGSRRARSSRGRNRARPVAKGEEHLDGNDSSSSRSGESGSTYYVIPSGRQKVHVLVRINKHFHFTLK